MTMKKMYLFLLLIPFFLFSCNNEIENEGTENVDYKEIIITEYGADPTGNLDCSRLINTIIDLLPASGGVIVIPEGTFVLDSPITINKNYVTIKGVNPGMRSNVDVKDLEGILGPGGGSKLVLRNAEYGIHISPVSDVNGAKNRISGVEIKDLLISGGEASHGTGIFVEHDNDRCNIDNVIGINLETGIRANAADAMTIRDSWLCEMQNSIVMENGIQNMISGCQLGAQPSGVTCHLIGQTNFLFTGNHVYPDGATNLKLERCNYVNITSNNFKSYYNGIIDIQGDNNMLEGNMIWLDAYTDNQTGEKGNDFGILRVEGKNNFVTSNTLSCKWSSSVVNPVTVRSIGGPNRFSNLMIDDLNSTMVFYAQENDKIDNCGVEDENILIERIVYNGKIGYLDVNSTDDDELASKEWFNTTFSDGTILSGDEDFSEFSVIFVHIDRSGLERGVDALLQIVSQETVSSLQTYLENGGNLLLTNHATQLLVPLGRIADKWLPNIYGSGDGSSNNDTWGIYSYVGNTYDFCEHPIYDGLSKGSFSYGHDIFPLIGSGVKEDHNCMWDFNNIPESTGTNLFEEFRTENAADVIGTWQHVVDLAVGGVVEFKPTETVNGTCIAIGVAAYEWNQNNAANSYQSNVERMTLNAIQYLDSKWNAD